MLDSGPLGQEYAAPARGWMRETHPPPEVSCLLSVAIIYRAVLYIVDNTLSLLVVSVRRATKGCKETDGSEELTSGYNI